ncbi:hypothetical protein BDK51DRAFT_31530, partial [Blyttiomyces helicus]
MNSILGTFVLGASPSTPFPLPLSRPPGRASLVVTERRSTGRFRISFGQICPTTSTCWPNQRPKPTSSYSLVIVAFFRRHREPQEQEEREEQQRETQTWEAQQLHWQGVNRMWDDREQSWKEQQYPHLRASPYQYQMFRKET